MLSEEEKKAIELIKQYRKEIKDGDIKPIFILDTAINLITKLQKENKEKDNKVKQIINRLNNDIFRISKSKESNKWDDYRRCRLKSYRTKTREIKEYIEQEYFKKTLKEINK